MFIEVYELTGEAKKAAQKFVADNKAVVSAQWKIIEAIGAAGFRPSHDGGISTVYFKKDAKPTVGYRTVGKDGDQVECKPSMNTGAGKAAARSLVAAPKTTSWRTFANQFGWKGRSPFGTKNGRGIIYFATGVSVAKPKERFFVTYPRQLKDGWVAPAGLILKRESDMLRAIEDHNAYVAKAAP